MDKNTADIFCFYCKKKLDDDELFCVRHHKMKRCDECKNKRIDELVDEKFKDNNDYCFFSFGGDEYCEDHCNGWNGKDPRCECGSRRVDWFYYYTDDEINAEAY